MATKITVVNQALSHVGSQATVASLTEKSQEAKVCSLFIDDVLKEVLRDFDWPRCTTTATLALVEEDPTTEWDYSYRMPNDCIKAQRIISGMGYLEKGSERIPYEVFGDSSGGLIYTNEDEAVLQYTWLNTNYEQFSVDFVRALSAKLAFYIAPKLTAGDPFGVQQRVATIYASVLRDAAANAFNEENTDNNGDTESIKARS